MSAPVPLTPGAMPPGADDGGSLSGARRLLAADFARILHQTSGGKPVSGLRRLMHLSLPAMQVAILHRLAHLMHRRGHAVAAGLAADLSLRLTGASLHPGSRIGPGLFVPHPAGVVFCASAGRDLIVLPAALVGPARWAAPWQPFPEDAPRLGDGVVVGAHSAVQGACSIGDRAMVGVGVGLRGDLAAGVVSMLGQRMIVSRPAGRACDAG